MRSHVNFYLPSRLAESLGGETLVEVHRHVQVRLGAGATFTTEAADRSLAVRYVGRWFRLRLLLGSRRGTIGGRPWTAGENQARGSCGQPECARHVCLSAEVVTEESLRSRRSRRSWSPGCRPQDAVRGSWPDGSPASRLPHWGGGSPGTASAHGSRCRSVPPQAGCTWDVLYLVRRPGGIDRFSVEAPALAPSPGPPRSSSGPDRTDRNISSPWYQRTRSTYSRAHCRPRDARPWQPLMGTHGSG